MNDNEPDEREYMTDTEIVTLKDACKLYPQANLTISTLRAEASRGRLDIFRLGRRDYTTPAAMREMVRRCQDAARHRASTSTRDESNGLSETGSEVQELAATLSHNLILLDTKPDDEAFRAIVIEQAARLEQAMNASKSSGTPV